MKPSKKTPLKVTWKDLARPSAIRERILSGETVEVTRYNIIEAIIIAQKN
jgi:hypothetical protein